MNRFPFVIVAVLLSVSIVPVAAQDYPVACDAIGCDSCDGRSSCDSCFGNGCKVSGWGASIDALFLRRSNPSNRILAFNTDNPAQNLNAGDFSFGTETGFDLSLTRAIGTCNALELRYFGIDDWDARVTGATTRGDLLQFNAAVPLTTDAGDAITASYASKLQNAELNFRHLYLDWLEVMAGFRYLELKERGSGSLVNAAVPFDYAVATRNRLYGAQVGGQALLSSGDLFRFDVTGKAGIFGNDAAHNALVTTGVASLPASGAQDSTAFVGEIVLSAATHLTANVDLRGGYRLLWIDSVALTSDQLAATNFFTGNGIDGSGDVFYDGAFAGLEFTY